MTIIGCDPQYVMTTISAIGLDNLEENSFVHVHAGSSTLFGRDACYDFFRNMLHVYPPGFVGLYVPVRGLCTLGTYLCLLVPCRYRTRWL